MVQPISLHWMAEAENSKRTRENVLIDRDLLSKLISETSFLVAQARIYGKTEPECREVQGLLAQVTAAMNGKPFSADGNPGIECPICRQVVDDADYWDGDRCLKCRLEGVGRPDLANILSKPKSACDATWQELGKAHDKLDTSRESGFHRVPATAGGYWSVGKPAPDAHLESDYEDRTCLPDSGE